MGSQINEDWIAFGVVFGVCVGSAFYVNYQPNDENVGMPICITSNCNDELINCSSDEMCASAMEGIGDKCYGDNSYEERKECMENEFINDGDLTSTVCFNNDECENGINLLGQCVVQNQCYDDDAKKLVKFIKNVRVKKLKQKMSLKHRSKRFSLRRKLVDDDYYYYDGYNGYDYDQEWKYTEESIPSCYWDRCGSEITQCVNSNDCKSALEDVVNECDYDNCMEDTFINENNGLLTTVCNGDTTCRQTLDTLGECVMNSQCEQQDDDNNYTGNSFDCQCQCKESNQYEDGYKVQRDLETKRKLRKSSKLSKLNKLRKNKMNLRKKSKRRRMSKLTKKSPKSLFVKKFNKNLYERKHKKSSKLNKFNKMLTKRTKKDKLHKKTKKCLIKIHHQKQEEKDYKDAYGIYFD